MRVVHFAPFAPSACGLYEAARDMVIADRRAGHDAQLVDVGPTLVDGTHTDGKPGQIDNRGGTEVKSAKPSIANYADVIVAHSGMPDNWIVQCQAPIVWILHGRPGACFRPEQFGRGNSYSLMASLATWPRVKKMVTLWPYYVQFWKPIIPSEKLVCFSVPPIDENRFTLEGEKHDFGELGGKFNVMIADSWREDIDVYEITHGAIEFSKIRKDVKFHFYGVQTPYRCWEYLFTELRRMGTLGEVWGQRPNIEEIYRSADVFLSPHRIITRTIGEALSCGMPVIAANGCETATYTADPSEPETVVQALKEAYFDIISNLNDTKKRVNETARAFSLAEYGKKITEVYQEVTV